MKPTFWKLYFLLHRRKTSERTACDEDNCWKTVSCQQKRFQMMIPKHWLVWEVIREEHSRQFLPRRNDVVLHFVSHTFIVPFCASTKPMVFFSSKIQFVNGYGSFLISHLTLVDLSKPTTNMGIRNLFLNSLIWRKTPIWIFRGEELLIYVRFQFQMQWKCW